MDDKKDAVDDLKKAVEPIPPTAGERRASSYADRVKRWWNSRLHGSVRRPDPEGERRVECTVRDGAGRVVARAEGVRTKKRSARGAARQAAVGKVFVRAKKACGGGRASVDLSAMKFEYRVLEG